MFLLALIYHLCLFKFWHFEAGITAIHATCISAINIDWP